MDFKVENNTLLSVAIKSANLTYIKTFMAFALGMTIKIKCKN
jgi:hypothetical protein